MVVVEPGAVRLSDLLSRHLRVVEGREEGYCVVCGAYTTRGHRLRRAFSSSFTEYNRLLYWGDVVCPACAAALKTPELRRRSWLATLSELRFLTRTEVYWAVLEPPEPPFALYATRTGKKQGWIVLGAMVAWSREAYPVSFDGELVWVERRAAHRLHRLLDRLEAAGAKARELLSGCEPRTWAADREACRELDEVRGSPLWRLLAWARPKTKTHTTKSQ